MAHIDDDDIGDDDLRKLILTAAPLTTPNAERPSDYDVYAYLTNRATEPQRQAVQSALLGSPAFRQELKALAAAYAELDGENAVVQSLNMDAPSWSDTQRVRETTGAGAIRRWFNLRMVIGVATSVAAVVALVVVLRTSGNRLEVPRALIQVTAVGVLQPEFFATRLSGDDLQVPTAEAMDAAVGALKAQVSFRNGSWDLSSTPQANRESRRLARLVLIGHDGRPNEEITASVPEEASQLESWFLVLPTVEIAKASMVEDAMSYQPTTGFKAFVVFTYRGPDGYRATRVHEI